MALFIVCAGFIFSLTGSFSSAMQALFAAASAICMAVKFGAEIYRERKITKGHMVQFLALLLMLIFIMLKESSSVLYLILGEISRYFTGVVGFIYSKGINLGVTYSGIDTVVFFIILYGAAFGVLGRRNLKLVAGAYISLIFTWAVYIGLWTDMAENSIRLGLNLIEPLTGPLDYKAALFAMLTVEFLFIFRKEEGFRQNAVFSKKTLIAGGIGVSIFAACLIFYIAPVKIKDSEARGKVVIWDSQTDFRTPDYSSYGLDNIGMFGVLPKYLATKGYEVEIIKEISDKTLADAQIFVSFNPLDVPDENALESLWSFVRQGGSALLVGDHTGYEQIRLPINKMLEPVGMEINFDSAVPFKSLWTDDFILRKHEIFGGVSDRQVQMVVGASLKLPLSAKPLVIGRAGYSDGGDLHNTADGYLGDMQFMRGERIGDLVLAAECGYGEGKFMVFGDTSHFQNTVLAYSYPFVDNIFAYLSQNAKEGTISTASREIEGYEAYSIINMSHIENIGRDKTGQAEDGLFACSLRAGVMPVMNMDKDIKDALASVEKPEIIFIIEPAKAFDNEEIAALESFMEAGGVVVLTGDYDSPNATKNLAEHFGFGFDDMPLGRISPSKNADMAFWNACPLTFNNELLSYETEGAACLMDIWEYGVIAEKNIGEGSFFIIGDSDFFKNKNLEDASTYREGNVDFADYIFKKAIGRAVE